MIPDSLNVSIIIPAYNAASTIEETLASLRRQSFRSWEALVIDDGSTDGTAEIVQRVARVDARFRLISGDHRGVSAARNRGVDAARHDWILFHDDDDGMAPDGLAHLVQAAQADLPVDIVYGAWNIQTTDGFTIPGACVPADEDLFPIVARKCLSVIHSCLLRKEAFRRAGEFDERLATSEDWDLWQRLARMGVSHRSVPNVVAHYRMRASSASMDGRRMLLDGLEVLRRGYSHDPRVAASRYPNGLEASDLQKRQFRQLCLAAGRACGSGADPLPLIDLVPRPDSEFRLDPNYAASCFAPSALLATGRPLRTWGQAWQEMERTARLFADALEIRLDRSGFGAAMHATSRRIVPTLLAPLGRRHRLRASVARMQVRAYRLLARRA